MLVSRSSLVSGLLIVGLLLLSASPAPADEITFSLREQKETRAGSGRYHRLTRQQAWDPTKTAVIVCDVWDLHHSLNAVRRVEELAPRLDAFLQAARKQGMTIIHSPSDCMEAYADHPARKRALAAPRASDLPDDIESWCSRIPQEERAVYPLDQADGGDDDDPVEHAEWARKLREMGRNPGTPWKRQSKQIAIDRQRDYLSDRGDEVWNVLAQREIQNVILTGVHTNMCVLGRPFGLRQMARNGKNVVLVRDLTDTMYNPARWPYVSHFTGTDRIVDHIERFVCPTITSDQLLGGKPFRFSGDQRPHLAIVMAEQEYETDRTLTRFAADQLGKQFRVSLVYADDQNRNRIEGLEVLHSADVALISVRRRTLKPDQLGIVQAFVKAGKPVVGIRTASHAFSLRKGEPQPGLAQWTSFDAEVFGGNYTNHYGNQLKSEVHFAKDADKHPLLRGLSSGPFIQGGSLYKTAPLATGTTILLTGKVAEHPAEPVAWTFRRKDGGNSFYTSLGHPDDFQNPVFQQLLLNALCWSSGLAIDAELTGGKPQDAQPDFRNHWSLIAVPGSWEAGSRGAIKSHDGGAWYRCAVRVRERWISDDGLRLQPVGNKGQLKAWWNGRPLKLDADSGDWKIERDAIEVNDANLLVIRMEEGAGDRGWKSAPLLKSGDRSFKLAGRWQLRLGDEPSWSNIPLPARYGASTDIVFEPPVVSE